MRPPLGRNCQNNFEYNEHPQDMLPMLIVVKGGDRAIK